MRFVRYACLISFAAVLIAVALANRGMVTLRLLPVEIADLLGLDQTINLPLFLVILGGVLVGLLVGFVWEWIREYGERAAAAHTARELRRLEREVARLKGEKYEGQDDVLALLDRAS